MKISNKINFINMIKKFLTKQKDLEKKRKILKEIIKSLNISKNDKELYLEALDVLDEKSFNTLYVSFVNFSNKLEKEDNNKIIENNFSSFDLNKQKDIENKEKNSFSLLLNNI